MELFLGVTRNTGHFLIFPLTRKGLFSIHAEQYPPPDLNREEFFSKALSGREVSPHCRAEGWSYFLPVNVLADSGPIFWSPGGDLPGNGCGSAFGKSVFFSLRVP